MDTPRPDFKSHASRLWKQCIQTLNAHWFGRIYNSTTMNISICNARKLIGLKILILGAAELQIRQNGASDRWFVRTGSPHQAITGLQDYTLNYAPRWGVFGELLECRSAGQNSSIRLI